ncbi:MAG: GNAT family N-acetyltransferase [Chitinophagaceae bacterium]|nr:GNAT family N-acetyltransferase [Chitinophagaceae bacterium]
MNKCVIDKVPLDLVWQIRQRVMYPDAPVAAVQLPHDEDGQHLGIWVNEKPVSIVSLFRDGDRFQFRKFATETGQQGKGYGSYLLQHLVQLAKDQHAAVLWCNARVSATAFYARFDFSATGAPWQKNGIDFIKMEKLLK